MTPKRLSKGSIPHCCPTYSPHRWRGEAIQKPRKDRELKDGEDEVMRGRMSALTNAVVVLYILNDIVLFSVYSSIVFVVFNCCCYILILS